MLIHFTELKHDDRTEAIEKLHHLSGRSAVINLPFFPTFTKRPFHAHLARTASPTISNPEHRFSNPGVMHQNEYNALIIAHVPNPLFAAL
jgi:hypothetical protein